MGTSPASDGYDRGARIAARVRVFLDQAIEGISQPSGYTEPILHRYRQARKAEG